MEDAFTIGNRLRDEALKAKEQNLNDANWQMLRSDIYVRDKGICWICNTFVELKDYDLGHLVDRCKNGSDTYDNLAVMHRSCNLSKPKHTTLEEAMKWKLTPKYLTERPISMFDSSKSIWNGYPCHHAHSKKPINQLSLEIDNEKQKANKELINSYVKVHPELTENVRLEAIKLLSQILDMPENKVKPIVVNPIQEKLTNTPIIPNKESRVNFYNDVLIDNDHHYEINNNSLTINDITPLNSRYQVKIRRKRNYTPKQDIEAAKQLVIEYFKNHTELCFKKVDHNRSATFKKLSKDLSIPIRDIRDWITEAGLVEKKKVVCNGDQYLYVVNNLDKLTKDNLSSPIGEKPNDKIKRMNLTSYQLQIFYFLIGQTDRVSPKNLHGIIKQISRLKYKGLL